MSSRIDRTHIGKELLTTIGRNHFETLVCDGYFTQGDHALEFGAILRDSTPDYRLYYSFDGVGIDIIRHDMHLVLTTSNFGTPFDEHMWHFIGQSAVRQIYSLETVTEADRIRIARRMIEQNAEAIKTFQRHIKKVIEAD